MFNIKKLYSTAAALSLLHYSLLILGPLLIVAFTFTYLEGSNVVYKQLPTGLQLSGPIAAYLILHLVFRRSLRPLWQPYQAELRKLQRGLDAARIHPGTAVQLARSFAEFASAYLAVEVLLRTRPQNQVNQFLSMSRKVLQGLGNVVGPAAVVYESGYVLGLADILNARLNSKAFRSRLANVVREILKEVSVTEGRDNALRIRGDFDHAVASLRNFIWRECENAINAPDRTEDEEDKEDEADEEHES